MVNLEVVIELIDLWQRISKTQSCKLVSDAKLLVIVK